MLHLDYLSILVTHSFGFRMRGSSYFNPEYEMQRMDPECEMRRMICGREIFGYGYSRDFEPIPICLNLRQILGDFKIYETFIYLCVNLLFSMYEYIMR